MSTHARTVALTLYDGGTFDLAQAAARAGLTEGEFARCLRRHGVAIRERRGGAASESFARRAD